MWAYKMFIDRIEVSKSFYKELLNMDELNKDNDYYNKLFRGVKIVINRELKQGYKIIYK